MVDKAESQEICFVPGDDYRRVIRASAPESMRPGEIVDEQGRILGEHDGYPGFTVGQRRGLGVAAGEPRYVLRTDPESNRVIIGRRADLEGGAFQVSEPNWLLADPPALPLRASVQIRYRSRPSPCTVKAAGGRRLQVELDEPRFAIAAGQAAVFYDGDRVLGGGWIETEEEGADVESGSGR
ncbi:MAG: aminomethyltransferase beta-barrel domain-containing protein [Planctomycetota bacterium]